ncbi:hypothetical protein [Nocardioides sp. zg-DK7169]|uniref:hypothetical protein n=1 Tax=Nocardioides sp. zg-DK7169 TaxID=2736600 RepID=UPI001554ECA1|nr:hypothetical protein [Nocardioides sp. zg-DK7169]NPC97259.1 hypothetical protein [Nocardioides sp. zg-DK7169]
MALIHSTPQEFTVKHLVTASELEALTALFAAELARGWIPHRADLEDALDRLRAARPA